MCIRDRLQGLPGGAGRKLGEDVDFAHAAADDRAEIVVREAGTAVQHERDADLSLIHI